MERNGQRKGEERRGEVAKERERMRRQIVREVD
jgi:hypothetical protein